MMSSVVATILYASQEVHHACLASIGATGYTIAYTLHLAPVGTSLFLDPRMTLSVFR
jgi:hypothetical protein